MWQGDRGHHSLPFLLFGKTGWNWKGGPQLPPRRPSLPLIKPPHSPHHQHYCYHHHNSTTPSPAPAWVDSPGRFSDLPCLCDTSGIVRGWQRTGSPGVGRAGLKVSSISLCMMDAARGPGHLKMHQTSLANACSPPLSLSLPPACAHTNTHMYCHSVGFKGKLSEQFPRRRSQKTARTFLRRKILRWWQWMGPYRQISYSFR